MISKVDGVDAGGRIGEQETYSLVFDLIRRYCEREGWIPVGWRVFTVGPWTITVNGTPAEHENVPPYHALIAHQDIVAFLLLNPFRGTVGGWSGAEDALIRDLEIAVGETGS